MSRLGCSVAVRFGVTQIRRPGLPTGNSIRTAYLRVSKLEAADDDAASVG